jgi:sulfate transport system permease protein
MAIEAGLPRRGVTSVTSRQGSVLGRWLLTGMVLVWFGLLVFLPLAALARQAFSGGVARLLSPLGSTDFLGSFCLTLGITVIATLVNTIFGVAFALVLVRQRFWGRALADAFVDMPFAISPVVAGLMLVVLYGPDGWIGRWLEQAGVRVVYAWPGMVVATMFVTLPFVVREVVPVLREFGLDQVEAAFTLGAKRWVTLWRVTLPSIRWALGYGVMLTIARSLGEFGAILVVSGNLLGRTQTTTLYVHDGIESFQPQGAYAASLVLAAISILLLAGMECLRKRSHSQASE